MEEYAIPNAVKWVVVTGASSGIGRAIASKLLVEGFGVIGISRTPINEASPNYRSLLVDLSDLNALTQALGQLGRVDAIVHAAGFMHTASVGSLNPEDGAAMWAVHVQAASVLVNELISKMPDGGRIVLIGSRTAAGAAGRSQYAATKAALIGMSRSWAAELASRQITVNVVAPGATETPMLTDPNRVSTPPKKPPMGRFINPEEIAGSVAFLLGPYAGTITGQQLVICGGASL
ncbi:MAG: SDR family oxidoreductase [Candidatus Competibacteraceae bacterium]|nr:SDR family oxidoreductase [Candidatus Competibacteraceae bacterium]